MHRCVVIADDLTGGNATGVMISGYGYDTYSIVNMEGLDPNNMPECDCIVYPTNSRQVSADTAYKLVYNATKFFMNDNIKVYSKRIDSTLRGNLGSETDAMLDALDNDAIAMVVPCFPQAERVDGPVEEFVLILFEIHERLLLELLFQLPGGGIGER